MDGQPGRVANTRRISLLTRAVRLEALNGRLHLGLDADVAGRADADKQRAGLGIDHQRAVRVSSHDAEDTLLGDHLLGVDVR
jgi:hypothetical protein